MQQQEGIVLEVAGEIAKVKTSRHNDCDNCGACPGNAAIVLEAYNPVGARPGQFVIVEVQEVNMLKAAFIVYIAPLAAIFFGAALGDLAAAKTGYPAGWLQTGGGLLGFIISVMYIKFFDRNARANVKMRPVITRILS